MEDSPFTPTQVLSLIEAAIAKADSMIGFFPRRQLYLAKGMVEMAYLLFPDLKQELLTLDGRICRKINDTKYFD